MADANSAVAQFLTVAEAALALRLSAMTLYRLLERGEFPAVRVGRRYSIPVQAVNGFAEAAMSTGQVVDTADWRAVLLQDAR
jgi:excisionase family DNA binding protein